MPIEQALDYDMLQAALLKRYESTEEGFKRRCKKCRPDSGETFQQFTSRLKSYFTRWVDMARIEKTYEGLSDLIFRDQLAFICTKELELFLKEREPQSLGQASKLADQFKEARYTDIVILTFRGSDRSQLRSRSRSRSMSPSRRFQPQGPQQARDPCFICGDWRHIAQFCLDKHRNNRIGVAAAHTNYRVRSRYPKKQVRFQSYKQEAKQDFDEDKMDESQVCGACIIPIDMVSYVQAHGKNTKYTFTSDTLRVSASSQMTSCSDNMKTVQGMLGQKIVNVLRDIGCAGVIVKQSLVPEKFIYS